MAQRIWNVLKAIYGEVIFILDIEGLQLMITTIVNMFLRTAILI